MPDTSTVAAAGSALAITSGAAGTIVSWWYSLPSAVVVSLLGILLSLGINFLFRWLAYRREGRLRRREHEARVKYYGSEPVADSDVAPL